jgi:hypothetical protein
VVRCFVSNPPPLGMPRTPPPAPLIQLEKEAKLHAVDEYMAHVERLCDTVLPHGWATRATAASSAAAGPRSAAGVTSSDHPRCHVYLASDEAALESDVRLRYPHLHIITNKEGLRTGARRCRSPLWSWGGKETDPQ